MKKLITFLLSLIAFLSTVYVQAQTKQGSLVFGGGLGYTSNRQETAAEDIKTSTVSFSPSVGYFVIDNLSVGIDLQLSQTKRDDGFGGDDKVKTFLAGPFVRYYKFTSNDKFAFYGQAGFQFGTTKTEPDGGNEVKSGTFNFYISPGFSYFFNEHWALDLQFRGIQYQTYDPNKDVDNNKQTSFTFGVDSLDPTLGVRFYLGK
ncbi:MAG TPA: porin family protein [Ohtaekwangia sp.]|uniref:porin family protein n=1 Tax=Ohtaekwangia sp. TaxID=2066019 RepID=UPI002F939E3A